MASNAGAASSSDARLPDRAAEPEGITVIATTIARRTNPAASSRASCEPPVSAAGRHVMAGEIRGLDELVAWLGRLSEFGFTIREHDVFGNDEHLCALSYMGARRPGVEVEIRVTSVFHFRAGRQVERWMYPEDMAAWDAIFNS
jgi:hypothetical protein